MLTAGGLWQSKDRKPPHCQVYNPKMNLGKRDFQNICRLIRDNLDEVTTDCNMLDLDRNGGTCSNYKAFLSFENSGKPDIWLNDRSFSFQASEDPQQECNLYQYHEYSTVVYACDNRIDLSYREDLDVFDNFDFPNILGGSGGAGGLFGDDYGDDDSEHSAFLHKSVPSFARSNNLPSISSMQRSMSIGSASNSPFGGLSLPAFWQGKTNLQGGFMARSMPVGGPPKSLDNTNDPFAGLNIATDSEMSASTSKNLPQMNSSPSSSSSNEKIYDSTDEFFNMSDLLSQFSDIADSYSANDYETIDVATTKDKPVIKTQNKEPVQPTKTKNKPARKEKHRVSTTKELLSKVLAQAGLSHHLEKLSNHGCWCGFLNDPNFGGHLGIPMDDIDMLCRSHHSCTNCAKFEPSPCSQHNIDNDPSYFHSDSSDNIFNAHYLATFDSKTNEWECGKQDSCLKSRCECDMNFVTSMKDKILQLEKSHQELGLDKLLSDLESTSSDGMNINDLSIEAITYVEVVNPKQQCPKKVNHYVEDSHGPNNAMSPIGPGTKRDQPLDNNDDDQPIGFMARRAGGVINAPPLDPMDDEEHNSDGDDDNNNKDKKIKFKFRSGNVKIPKGNKRKNMCCGTNPDTWVVYDASLFDCVEEHVYPKSSTLKI